MIYTKAVGKLLITLILLHCCLNCRAYTQISSNVAGADDRSDGGGGGGPKIYKAVNFDLIFPKSFNSSENVISTTPETIPSPTKTTSSSGSSSSGGGTFVGQPYYPLPQSNEPATDVVEQREPTLFITPAPAIQPLPTTAPSNEADIYDTQQQQQQNYNARVVTQNAINIQQQQQLLDNNKAEKEQEEQMEQQQYLATGRAVDYHAGYPFGQLITPLIKNAPRPVYRKPVTTYSTFPSSVSSSSLSSVAAAAPSNVGKIIYPQAMYQQKPPSQAEIDKLRGKGTFRDRFSPSEGVASHSFKSNHDHSHDHSHDHHNHAPTYTQVGKTAAASNMVNTYVPPSNLYSFPPNNVNYPTQSQDTKLASPSDTVNSYSAPASGPLKNTNYNSDTSNSNSSPYQYNGPISAGYLPPSNDNGDNGGGKEEAKNNNDGGGGDGDLDMGGGGGDDSVGVLPASAMDQLNDGGGNGDMSSSDMSGGDMAGSMDSQDAPDDNSYDTGKEYPTPPPGWLKEHPEAGQDHPHDDEQQPKKPDIVFDHSHDHYRKPDIIFDHDYYHHSYPSYPIYHHPYPEVIYDDDHHHDHHHIEPPPPPTTTTEAPPPEPPPEPRVKKYSYFYIGRKLWYIPLYFTIWFSFYVLWLILKSIARHKVNLPNHYVSRRSVNYDLSKTKQESLNQLTVKVLDQIDRFKRKYLN